MDKYLFLMKNDNEEWMLLSVGGKILTTGYPEGTPRVVVSDRTTIPTLDWEAHARIVEHRD